MDKVLKLYLTIRKPRNFLMILVFFIAVSLAAHELMGYDVEFGITNLSLSVEATIAGAVLMVVAEESAELQRTNVTAQGQMLEALVKMAEAERETMASQFDLLKALKAQDEILLSLMEKRNDGTSRDQKQQSGEYPMGFELARSSSASTAE